MKGRQVILTNRAFTHEDLLRFMTERWDTEKYNSFLTDPALKLYTDRYVLLPATERYMIIVYSRAAGGLFSRKNKVVLSILNTPAGAREMMLRSIPTHNIFFGAAKIASTMSDKEDREGPTEEIMQKYAAYIRSLLQEAGYLKSYFLDIYFAHELKLKLCTVRKSQGQLTVEIYNTGSFNSIEQDL